MWSTMLMRVIVDIVLWSMHMVMRVGMGMRRGQLRLPERIAWLLIEMNWSIYWTIVLLFRERNTIRSRRTIEIWPRCEMWTMVATWSIELLRLLLWRRWSGWAMGWNIERQFGSTATIKRRRWRRRMYLQGNRFPVVRRQWRQWKWGWWSMVNVFLDR